MSLFTQSRFEFPYLYKFPGQASDERILFVTRENAVMLWYRRAGVVGASVVIAIVGLMLGELLRESLGTTSTLLELGAVLFAVVFGVLGWWWISTLWQKSLMIVTTQRLTKFIYTTPFNRHNLSLPLDMVVDTGSYTKGFIQALFRLGTLTARSSASSSGASTDDPERVNKKYFYIENVASAEDLQHYINKLLHAFRHSNERLATFRPFLPQLKGDDRKRFMEQYPEYWS
jgi:hypothetical protein